MAISKEKVQDMYQSGAIGLWKFLIQAKKDPKDITFKETYEPEVVAMLDQRMIQYTLKHLITNSIHALICLGV